MGLNTGHEAATTVLREDSYMRDAVGVGGLWHIEDKVLQRGSLCNLPMDTGRYHRLITRIGGEGHIHHIKDEVPYVAKELVLIDIPWNDLISWTIRGDAEHSPFRPETLSVSNSLKKFLQFEGAYPWSM